VISCGNDDTVTGVPRALPTAVAKEFEPLLVSVALAA